MITSDSCPNPFRDPRVRPQWAQLTRLAGDRAAILFEELRRRLGKIDGLREELSYQGPEWGWGPRYKVGERVLFSVVVLPGILEARAELEPPFRETLLHSSRVASRMKAATRRAPLIGDQTMLRVRLSNASLVRSFASMMIMKSKFDTSGS
jgi:hypothetical protein